MADIKQPLLYYLSHLHRHHSLNTVLMYQSSVAMHSYRFDRMNLVDLMDSILSSMINMMVAVMLTIAVVVDVMMLLLLMLMMLRLDPLPKFAMMIYWFAWVIHNNTVDQCQFWIKFVVVLDHTIMYRHVDDVMCPIAMDS